MSHNSIDLLGTVQSAVIYGLLMIDASALQMLLMVLTGCLERRERDALAYLIEENRPLAGRGDPCHSDEVSGTE